MLGADKNLAKNLLEACNSNLEMAINMHMENESSAAAGTAQEQPPVAAVAGASGKINF